MTTLFPLKIRYDNFTKDFLKELKDGYIVTDDLILEFNCKIDRKYHYLSPKHKFEITAAKDKTIIKVPKGMFYDGVTYGIDYKTRMLFALAHDCGCWASQETGVRFYERMFDNLAYEIIRKQGGWWFNAWRVERAVRAWDSLDC